MSWRRFVTDTGALEEALLKVMGKTAPIEVMDMDAAMTAAGLADHFEVEASVLCSSVVKLVLCTLRSVQDWPPVNACSELQMRLKKVQKRSGGKADFVPFIHADLRKCVARFACA